MYRIITEHNKTIKRFKTEREAEKYWDSLNGIYTKEDGTEEHIYIEDEDEYTDYIRIDEEVW